MDNLDDIIGVFTALKCKESRDGGLIESDCLQQSNLFVNRVCPTRDDAGILVSILYFLVDVRYQRGTGAVQKAADPQVNHAMVWRGESGKVIIIRLLFHVIMVSSHGMGQWELRNLSTQGRRIQCPGPG
jgi:hypothetical protein